MTPWPTGSRPTVRPIVEVARELGLSDEDMEPFGRGVVKVGLQAIDRLDSKAVDAGVRGRYVLVTAMTPTRHGEGKTTTAVGLAQHYAEWDAGRASASGSRHWGRCWA